MLFAPLSEKQKIISSQRSRRLCGKNRQYMLPLAVKSYYSLMWGTRSPRKICAVAREMGYRRLALTDTDNLYGLWPFLSACRQEGITPIVGAELSDPDTDRRPLRPNDRCAEFCDC